MPLIDAKSTDHLGGSPPRLLRRPRTNKCNADIFSLPPPLRGIGSKRHTGSSNRGCARLGGAVAPPLGMVKEEVTALVVLVRRNCCAVGTAVRWAVDDEVPSAVEEKTGPAAVRRMPPGLLDALPVHALKRYFDESETLEKSPWDRRAGKPR